ncbi:uncharacterized protein LOC116303555 [Actinia tenebrosa]|uniref:Uncharacterized protein LOC116303555 n=1 Tax=Actinia tenebrosa TaxID=6105 RepID=A0A6P8IRU7_ACTTE|nr:uncharacterized protein LOC116303555 [Actinia tenebrosa]
MTMTPNMILFVAVFGIFVVLVKSQSYDVLCSDIRGDKCVKDENCKCSEATFICNRFSRCDRPTLEDIRYRQPCRGIFKSSCVDDSDCNCKGDRLVCEDNECVRSKTITAF